MKTLLKVACFVVLTALCAITVRAQTPVDPKVIVNSGTDPTIDCSPYTSGATAICLGMDGIYQGTQASPLTVTYKTPFTPISFQWTGAASQLTTLYIEFLNVTPGTNLSCQSDIWYLCGFWLPTQNDSAGLYFYNPNGQENLPVSIGGGPTVIYPGFMTIGEYATVSLSPEPQSAVLFGTGLILLFLITRRKVLPQRRRELA